MKSALQQLMQERPLLNHFLSAFHTSHSFQSLFHIFVGKTYITQLSK